MAAASLTALPRASLKDAPVTTWRARSVRCFLQHTAICGTADVSMCVNYLHQMVASVVVFAASFRALRSSHGIEKEATGKRIMAQIRHKPKKGWRWRSCSTWMVPRAAARQPRSNEPLQQPKGLFGRLMAEFREQAQPKFLVPATLLAMSLTGIQGLRAFLSGRLLDLAVQQPPAAFHDFALIAGIYFGATLFSYVANVVEGILFALARWNMSMAMRQKLFAALMRQEVTFLEGNSSGAFVSRLTNDTDQMQQVLNRAPETLLTNLLRCGMSLLLMARQHRMLTFISVLPLPFAMALVRRTGRVVGRFGVMQNDALARVNAVASEAVSSARAVQLVGAEEEEVGEYRLAIGGYLKVIRQTLFAETALRFVSQLVNDACTDVPLMCLSCWLIACGQLTVGQFYTYRTLLFSYRRGFRELAELFTGITRAEAVSRRYFELTDRIPKVSSSPGARKLHQATVVGNIKLDGVSFRYPGQEQWALRDVQLHVEPGEIVALVGGSGAGKSTILRLCARLMDPEIGAVMLDGFDLRKLELQSLRQCIGYVDQDPAIFDRSVEANIAYGIAAVRGQTNCDRTAVLEEAARSACAHDFIKTLPGGYDERLGERGSRVSGGQRQRLALARALARNTPIMLLDEPTSALDGKTEKAVATAISRLASEGKTVLVAAHRLGTVACASRIIVLEAGSVVEEGRRKELLARPGSRYRAIVEPSFELP